MQKLITFAALLFCLMLPSKIFAVEIKIDQSPAQIGSEEFIIKTSVYFSGSTDANNFLRVDLYKNDTNDYFGETWNGASWYSGSEGTSYFPIEIKEGSGSAELKARLPSPLPSSYTGPGAYKLKIRRYTASGNAASSDAYTPADIQISLATPTPIPSPSPTPIPTTPTHTPKATVVPSPTTDPTQKSTPSPQASKAPKSAEKLDASSSGRVMGISSLSAGKTATVSDQPQADIQTPNKSKTYPLLLAGSGLCFLAVAAPKLKDLITSLVSNHFSG